MMKPHQVDDDQAGTGPQVKAPALEPSQDTKYAVNDEDQALSICRSLMEQSDKIIANAATITAVLNGQAPRPPEALRQRGRSWMPNCSSRFLRNQCSLVATRFASHILKASSLTNAQLPAGWPLGPTKNAIYREGFTTMARSWPNWPWFVNQTSNESGTFGLAYAVYFDEFSWRPEFVSSTRGFVPIGTRVSDEDGPPLFMVRYDYRVDALLKQVRRAEKSKLGGWDREAIEAAVNSASTKGIDESTKNARERANQTREATTHEPYERAYRAVETWILFSVDADGTVSQHILLADDATQRANQKFHDTKSNPPRILYQRRARFRSMNHVVTPVLFDPETGKIHGSWGVAQHLWTMALEFEKSFNDWIASLKLAVKFKVQVNQGVNPQEVLMHVDDVVARLSGAIYAGNVAAVPTDPKPFQALLDTFAAAGREAVGNLIPPIPQTPDDVKAAQIDAKLAEQQQRREHNLQMQLIQFAKLTTEMARRALDKRQRDPLARAFRKKLEDSGLTEEEIGLLASDSRMNTIMEFTEYAAKQRAAFAAAKAGNPFYNQRELERVQAEAIGGQGFADSVMLPGDDATQEREARRQQGQETATMLAGITQEVLPGDLDYFHLLELRPVLELETIRGAQTGDFANAMRLLSHYAAHWTGATAKKSWPKGYSGNNEKAFLAKVADTIQTGQLPPEGFEDKQDIIALAEQQMASQPAVSGPSTEAPVAANGATPAGLEQLVSSTAA